MKIVTRTTLLAALFLCTSLAQAQFVWVDGKGIKQYSDQPPPAGTPARNILKHPGGVPKAADENAPAATAAAAPEAPSGPSLAEREADYRKRHQDKADADAKAAEAARTAATKNQRCTAARAAQAQLNSGVRLAKVGPNGERVVVDDAVRGQESARVNRALRDCN